MNSGKMGTVGLDQEIGYNPILSATVKNEQGVRDVGTLSEYSLQGSVKDEFIEDVKNILRGLCDNVECEPFIGKVESYIGCNKIAVYGRRKVLGIELSIEKVLSLPSYQDNYKNIFQILFLWFLINFERSSFKNRIFNF